MAYLYSRGFICPGIAWAFHNPCVIRFTARKGRQFGISQKRKRCSPSHRWMANQNPERTTPLERSRSKVSCSNEVCNYLHSEKVYIYWVCFCSLSSIGNGTINCRYYSGDPISSWVKIYYPTIGHWSGWVLSFFNMISMPFLTSVVSGLCQFFSSIRWFKYSLYYLFYRCCLICCIRYHEDSRPGFRIVRSHSGVLLIESLIRKWPGINTLRSLGSNDDGVNGLELRIPSISICMSLVLHMWRVSFMMRFKWCFSACTVASHNPTKCGVQGGLKTTLRYCLTSSFVYVYSFQNLFL